MVDLNEINFPNHTIQEVVELVGYGTPQRAWLANKLQELIELRDYREEVLRANRLVTRY